MERTNRERRLFTANQLTTKLSVRAPRAVGQVKTTPYLEAHDGVST